MNMLPRKVLVCLLFLHSIHGQLQINLHLTDRLYNDENNPDLQHDCLYAVAPIWRRFSPGQTISYCMGEWPSKWSIQKNNIDQTFTYATLSSRNITSQQLYLWSAPIDVIENYQFYLDQLPHSEKTSMAGELFYNCTLPYFGPQCQYVLSDYQSHHSSLNAIIRDFYCWNIYEPTTLTCYIHLQCNRGLPPSCLDWSEICDGKIDCLDHGEDEEHCWQLELHQCNENEYRCFNGQCIFKLFYMDMDYVFDCLDHSDEYLQGNLLEYQDYGNTCLMPEPSISYEDVSCGKTYNKYSMSLTSSCIPQRRILLLQSIFSVKPKSLLDECWSAFKCIIDMPISKNRFCDIRCLDGTCDRIIRKTCPTTIYSTAVPVLSGYIYLVYEKNHLHYWFHEVLKPTYICYKDHLLHDTKTWLLFNNGCRFYNTSLLPEDIERSGSISTSIDTLNQWLQTWTSWIYNDSIVCNETSLYRCMDSYKCISKSRLYDRFQDCFHNDDEDISMWNKNCSIKRHTQVFRCETTNECIPRRFLQDGTCHCTIYGNASCDDELSGLIYNRNTIMFQNICDNMTDLSPIVINGQNHTDETECDQWTCNNIYTNCDGFWNCLNGVDELNCEPFPPLNCPEDNHVCLSLQTKQLMCLSIEKANDGNVDCVGATDEPTLCRTNEYGNEPNLFYCTNHSSESCISLDQLCDMEIQCTNQEDEQSCTIDDLYKYQKVSGVCEDNYEVDGSDVARAFCRVFDTNKKKSTLENFKLNQFQYSGLVYEPVIVRDVPGFVFPRATMNQPLLSYQPRCHRGLDLQVWLDKERNLTTHTCLCPPSYYGDICQFQNQRISITVRLSVPFNSIKIPLIVILTLIDHTDQRTIHSFEQFVYSSKKHCDGKFHVYLLYSIRPKNSTQHYAVHIDIYEKISLKYRGSLVKLLLFSFLPIHRLSFLIDIPPVSDMTDHCVDHQCIHGQCRKYFNDPHNTTFCQCHHGWSGRYCTTQHTCLCSADSVCLGQLANNRSLCICPSNKIGQRCLFNNTLCQMARYKCLNNGQCITVNQYIAFDQQVICICPKGFTGERCEIVQTKLILSFDKKILVPSSIRIHVFKETRYLPIERVTTFKTIPFGQDSVTIYWSFRFHIVYIEWEKSYYLVVLQRIYNQSAVIEKTLRPSDRCLHISELFNQTIVNDHLIRRMKYYQIPCRINSSCFYDDIHLCFCQDHGSERVSNCFKFNYDLRINCTNKNGCENGGDCFQDDRDCPETSMCVCPVCYYGARCQFTTTGFSLSLDAILGYHIRPNVNLSRQKTAVLVSLILSIVITLAGLVNGVVSLMTFKEKKTRDAGCGIYLLWTSINTLLTTIILTLKIWILIFTQMGSIENRSFLSVQCILSDFLLRYGLTMDQWLTTCVAIERAYITIKGVNFNKKKIKLIAKFVIIGLVVMTMGTAVHDPIHRTLFDEDNDEIKRIWCIAKYSSAIHTLNSIMTIFHIIVPFIINLISAIIIIKMSAQQRASAQKQQNYQKILNEQIQQHKNLLIAPIVLIILSIPRLIISFASGCMKSSSDSWLYLLGYFISLIPPLLTFILFVLPSSIYYEAFRKVVSQYRNRLRRR